MRAALSLPVLALCVLALVSGFWGKRAVAAGPSCPPMLLLASRGSGDKQSQDEGIGRPELALKTKLQDLVPGLQTWANPYSAVGVFAWNWGQIANGAGALTKLSGVGLGAYHDSVVQGGDLLATKLRKTIRDCGGKTSIILAGYSQGAQVTADVFQRELSGAERSKVGAVVLFGDPYFFGGDRAVDRGSFSGRRDGLLGKRPKFGSTGPTLALSYCHSHDPICQGFFFRLGPTRTLDPGALTSKQHKNYTKFGEPDEAAKLIAAKLGLKKPSNDVVLRVTPERRGQLGPWKLDATGSFASARQAYGNASSCDVIPERREIYAGWQERHSVGWVFHLAEVEGGMPTAFDVCRGTPPAASFDRGACLGLRCVTSAGLRVGDPIATLTRLYPSASSHIEQNELRYWLVTTPQGSPLLTAATGGGKVYAFYVTLHLWQR